MVSGSRYSHASGVIVVSCKARFLEGEGDQRVLFDQVQQAVTTAIQGFVRQIPSQTPRHMEPFTRVTTDIRFPSGFGTLKEAFGLFTFYAPDGTEIRIELTYGSFVESSLKAVIVASVTGASLLMGYMESGPIVQTYAFEQRAAHTLCATELNVSYLSIDHYMAQVYRLQDLELPSDEHAAARLVAEKNASRDVCYLQAMLKQEGAAELDLDGLFGPKTLEAWKRYKRSLGPNVTDEMAIRQLISDRRLDWGVIGMSVDAIIRTISTGHFGN